MQDPSPSRAGFAGALAQHPLKIGEGVPVPPDGSQTEWEFAGSVTSGAQAPACFTLSQR